MKPVADAALAERILDQALVLAEAGGWENLHLHTLADALDIPLGAIQACYAQKDDLVEAWFDRADRAAVQPRDSSGFHELPPAARLERVMLAWLEALQPHRRLTREMLAYKLEPGHLHLQISSLMRISRTVQWFREAAQQDSRGLQRMFEETGLTLVYLITFVRWLYDDSPDTRNTREYLARALRCHTGCLAGPERRAVAAPADTSRPGETVTGAKG